MNIYEKGWCKNIKKRKYIFYNNRKECLKNGHENNYWIDVPRKCRRDYDDGYMLLINSFLVRLERTLGEKLTRGSPIQPEQYYVDEDYTLYFTITLPVTKNNCRDEWLDSIKLLEVYYGYEKQFFKLCPLIIKKNTKNSVGKLTLLYKEFDEV